MTRQLVATDQDVAVVRVQVMDAQFGVVSVIDPTLPRPAFKPPRTFDDLTTAEQSLLRPPAWLAPCRYEHGRTR